MSTDMLASLGTLEYSTPRRQARLRISLQVAIEVLIAAGIMIVTVSSVELFVNGTYRGLDYLFRYLLLLLLIVFGTLIAVLVSLWRSRSIRNGVMNLEFPIRRINGHWTRVVEFNEVVDVGFTDRTGGLFGVALALKDGTKVFLDQKGFGSDGYGILDSICKAFGKSYEEGVKTPLLAGTRYRFNVARLRRVENGIMVMAAPVWTFSRRETKRIPIEQIRKAERVSTQYSGDGYLVWLSDGSSFILRSGDVAAAGLPALEVWMSKVRGPKAPSDPLGS
jgi:hypothetical protein